MAPLIKQFGTTRDFHTPSEQHVRTSIPGYSYVRDGHNQRKLRSKATTDDKTRYTHYPLTLLHFTEFV